MPELIDFTPARPSVRGFPSTRYQGSKYKIVDWIDRSTRHLRGSSVLDAFSGTGCVGYMYKRNGRRVICNDALKFNYYIGLALIENKNVRLNADDLDFLLNKHSGMSYPTFIADTFQNIYFSDDENIWLDIVITNIRCLENRYKQALAFYALFQSCIIKRPYNLFHRKNLYLRQAKVARSFGNKTTWDRPFEEHFRKFAAEANAAVFDNGRDNRAQCSHIFNVNVNADIIYIDTPYISARGAGVNYLDFYHFLEGIVRYEQWPTLIDNTSKHRKLQNSRNEWCSREQIHGAFEGLFAKFRNSALAVSYRADGTPTIPELVAMLKQQGKTVEVNTLDYKYALSKTASREVLITAV